MSMSKQSRFSHSHASRSGILLALVLSLAACGSAATRSGATTSTDHKGRMRGYVESSRVTDFCPDQSARRDDERCVVARGWDYARGQAIVRTYDPSGNLMSTQYPPGADLSLTELERERAAELVKSDPRTRDIVNKPDVMLWHGGFAIRGPGDPFCDRGSRCIRVIAATNNGNDVILHSVVDLMSDRVVYPDYVPSVRKAAISSTEH